MALSAPLYECQHCGDPVTCAERKRNGYVCDWCVVQAAREAYARRHGAGFAQEFTVDGSIN